VLYVCVLVKSIGNLGLKIKIKVKVKGQCPAHMGVMSSNAVGLTWILNQRVFLVRFIRLLWLA